jgi:dTDP-glucose 4,6-dehydratase
MKKALVAGGAGFIGSHLCEFLLEKGYNVLAVDCLVTGREKNISHLSSNKNFKFLNHNIIEPLQLVESFDEIYNLASPASPIDFEKIPDFILKTSSLGHMNLLELAKKTKARILFASTSEVYGDPLVHPQVETYLGNVDCIGIRGCYDEAKRFGEAISMAYFRLHKVNIRIARIFNTYGPRMRPEDGRVIPNFFTQALAGKPLTIYGDGSQTRSLCYVKDLVAGLYALVQSQSTEPVNIGNPDEYTILELAKTVAKVCGANYKIESKPLPPSDPKKRKPDITKAKKLLNWVPEISLNDGMAHTLEYFKSDEGKL